MQKPEDDAILALGRSRLGAWQQPVMTLGALLLLAGVLLPLAGVLVRVRRGEQADAASAEFRKAVVAATDSHGPLLGTLTNLEVDYATEQLTTLAEREPARTMGRYAALQAQYAEWIAAQGRSDLQATLDAAEQAYAQAEQAQAHARQLSLRHQAALGEYLRYGGFVGGTGLVLVLWAALSGLRRRPQV